MNKFSIILFIFFATLLSCNDPELTPQLTAEEGEELSGGISGTTNLQSSDAFGQEVSGLSQDQALSFFVGNSFFKQNWVTAPASTTARDGLGPYFNARSCSSCHLKDGRGRPPLFNGEMSQGLLLRLSTPGTDNHGGPLSEPVYGGQLQDQSIMGVMTEGGFEILYSEVSGNYPDGSTYSLRKPLYQLFDLSYGDMAANVMVSPRVGQQIIGLGLLEAVEEQTILENVDLNDLDKNGISGKANYVWDVKHQKTTLGRFGWKANQPSLEQQVSGAFLGDMGITSYLFPDEECTEDCSEIANGGTPEIENDDLQKTILYAQSLAVPARRNWKNQEVLNGKAHFMKVGCGSCHLPVMQTGTHPAVAALSNQTIRPFTDLLLHDMGEGLADNRPDFLAESNEWRTQPLWGIGLIQTVNGHTFLLHDGRARNIEEAILWHGGEAKESNDAFQHLDKTERDQLLQFISSL